MNRSRPIAYPFCRLRFGACSLLVLVALGFPGSLAAEPIAKPAGAEVRPAPRSEMSAALAASLPKYQPAAPVAATAGESSEGFVLLPKLTVRDKPIPPFSERESHTRIGLGELLIKRYPGASTKSQYVGEPHSYNYALQKYDDDERQRVRHDWNDFADLLRLTGDLPGSKLLKEEIEAATLRRFDGHTEVIDRSANNGRR